MKIEPVTQGMINALVRAVGGHVPAMCCGLLDVDLDRGRGVLDDTGLKHCLWDSKGHRITITVSRADGSVIAARANEPDQEKFTLSCSIRKKKSGGQYRGNTYVCPRCGDLVREGFKCECGE